MEDPALYPAASCVRLPNAVTLRNIEAVRAEMLDHLTRSRSIEIDCSELMEADLSLVQLVVSLRKSALQAGGDVSLMRPASGALLEVLNRGGFLGSRKAGPDENDLFWLSGTDQHE